MAINDLDGVIKQTESMIALYEEMERLAKTDEQRETARALAENRREYLAIVMKNLQPKESGTQNGKNEKS